MASRVTTLIARSLLALALALLWTRANAVEQQYRAAITKIFLAQYQAMPLFRLNPVFPGDVITLKNETEYARHSLCYPKLTVGQYKAIQGYQQGESIALSGGLKVGGNILDDEVVAIEAAGDVKFARTTTIAITPLAIDEVDLATLSSSRSQDPNCKIVLDLLAGAAKGAVLAQAVLHGRVAALLTGEFGVGVDVQARGELLSRMEGALKIDKAAISVAGNRVSVVVTESPAPMSLAIVPSGFNREELARITQYLQGKRGADLEIAVQEAITADNVGLFKKIELRIEELLGNDELKNKERWAENIAGGYPLDKLKGDKGVEFEKVATYGAAMEIARLEAPPRR